jgi:hypothetical protein
LQFFPFSGIRASASAHQLLPIYLKEPGGVSSIMMSSLLAVLQSGTSSPAVLLILSFKDYFTAFLVLIITKSIQKTVFKNIFLGVYYKNCDLLNSRSAIKE